MCVSQMAHYWITIVFKKHLNQERKMYSLFRVREIYKVAPGQLRPCVIDTDLSPGVAREPDSSRGIIF